MSTLCKARGFVFGKEEKLESDREFAVFAEDFGKVKIFGKAIRKIDSKLKSRIDIFSFVDFEFVQGKNRKTLTDSEILKKFKMVISSPKRFEVANRIVIAIDELVVSGAKENDLLSFIIEIFEILNSQSFKKEDCDLLYIYFLWNFFGILGFGPELEKCAGCSYKLIPQKNYFSCKEGGVICQKCLEKDKKFSTINADVVKIMRIIVQRNWQLLSKLKFSSISKKMLEDVSASYYFYLLDK